MIDSQGCCCNQLGGGWCHSYPPCLHLGISWTGRSLPIAHHGIHTTNILMRWGSLGGLLVVLVASLWEETMAWHTLMGWTTDLPISSPPTSWVKAGRRYNPPRARSQRLAKMLILSSKPSGFSSLQLVYFLNLRFFVDDSFGAIWCLLFFSCDEKLFMLSLMYTSRTFKLGFISWHVDPQPVAWEYCQQLHSPWPLVAEKNGLVEWPSWSSRVDSLEYSIWFKYIDVYSFIYLDRYIIITIIIYL